MRYLSASTDGVEPLATLRVESIEKKQSTYGVPYQITARGGYTVISFLLTSLDDASTYRIGDVLDLVRRPRN
jgi:hypothetical protein